MSTIRYKETNFDALATRQAIETPVQPALAHKYTDRMGARFEAPKLPSSQLKIVLLYFDLIKVFNIEEIEKLFTDDFVQSTAPASIHVPSRTKEEDLAFLRGMSEALEGRHLEVIHLVSRSPRIK